MNCSLVEYNHVKFTNMAPFFFFQILNFFPDNTFFKNLPLLCVFFVNQDPLPHIIKQTPFPNCAKYERLFFVLACFFSFRFSAKSWLSQVCQVCQKSMMFGVKCKHCR